MGSQSGFTFTVMVISDVYGAPGILEGLRSRACSSPGLVDKARDGISFNLKVRT